MRRMPPTGSYRFGEFLIHEATRELWRGGERLSLPGKAFDCITYLLDHRERAVGRDELTSAVWGRVDVSDSVLNQTVLYARRAFGDTGRVQSVIRTVVGFGYHWVAPVEVVEPGVTATESRGEAASSASRLRYFIRYRVLLGAAVLFAFAATFAFVMFRHAGERAVPTAHARSALVVLPVTTTGDDELAWLRLGLMDLIADRLRATGTAVVPSDNVVALARAFDTHSADDLGKLASAASARIVLQPRAEKENGHWRVELRTAYGQEPMLIARGIGDDALDAGLSAADEMAGKLGLPPAIASRGAGGERPLRELLQQVKAATLGDRLDEARRLIEQATPAQRQAPETVFRLAKIDAQAGRTDEAATALRTLLDSVTAERDALLRARILDALGVIATQRGDAVAAETLHDQAIALLRDSGDEGQLGKAYGNRAASRFAQGRDEDALEDFASARGALENAGDSLSLMFLDGNIGAMDMLRDRYREAVPTFERAATRLEALRIHYAALNDWDAAAQAKLILLEPAAAAPIETRLRELSTQVADPRSRFAAGLTRVEILAANGSSRAARELLEQLRDEFAATADPKLAGRANAVAARLWFAEDDHARAAQAADSAFAALGEADDSREQVRNWLTLVRAQIGAKQSDAASESVRRIAALAAHDDSTAARVYARLAQGELAGANGDTAAAREAFEQALADADRGRVPLDVLEAATSYAGWLIATHDLTKASAVVERVAPWVAQSYEASLLQLRLYRAAGLTSASMTMLERTRGLAGERRIPEALSTSP